MNSDTKVSIVIVSRNRTKALRRALSALRFQTHKSLEVIVVSDHENLEYAADVAPVQCVKHIHFDQPNISMARNLGIGAAAGEIIAFCDDDAVPEPCWASRLAAAFDDDNIGVVGGLVRGRNGFSVQWSAMEADVLGRSHMIEDCDGLIEPSNGRYGALIGTNVAFRKDALIALGGFDPDFAFFLDETDICLRMAAEGWITSFVPDAEVQHGFEKSAERATNRVPKTLFNLGRSKAIFLRKHARPNLWPAELERFEVEQKARLLRHMTLGLIESFAVNELLETLRAGYAEAVETKSTVRKIPQSYSSFLPFEISNCGQVGVVIAGRPSQASAMQKLALEFITQGRPVTVFQFSRTSLFHKRYFDALGFWVQTGGVFGRALREEPLFKMWTFKKRVAQEAKNLGKQRSIKEIVFV